MPAKTTPKTTPVVCMTLRLPAPLHQALHELAKGEARSGHGQIVAILQQALQQKTGGRHVR